ncbi:hypothetical protein [Halanaerobacter jeridensis]|uniref:Archaellum component FlaG (FlaF/FlaG flagellin family) n=1 Tax=Halanaerobacter jeridensis TaxID=706427 RepID=A0A938XXK8_9FIRM|nr:hypothetical protein [Halanaerobacter jeridensis]MBM7558131.1 archaellum component FlaG (FlaF/FlaG flagellin family) [Halanaerobacter jeridensis]
MLKLARKERDDSISPTWDIVSEEINTILVYDSEFKYCVEGEIILKNTGFGSAVDVSATFESENNNNMEVLIDARYKNPKENTVLEKDKNELGVLPSELVKIKTKWNIKESPSGTIKINSINKFNNVTSQKLYIKVRHIGEKEVIEFDNDNLAYWKLKWIKEPRNIIEKTLDFFKREDKSDVIDKYYNMEVWARNCKEKHGEPGFLQLKGRSWSESSIRKFVKIYGLLNVPPSATELQQNIPENESHYMWNKLFVNWVDDGIIEEGQNFKKDFTPKKMEDWIRSTFEIEPNGWNEGEDSFVVKEGSGASISFFVDKFGDVSVPPTAEELKACDPNNKTGWHRHFDYWKEQGIIN